MQVVLGKPCRFVPNVERTELDDLEKGLHTPSFDTYVSVLRRCCNKSSVKRLYTHMVATNSHRNVVLSNLVIRMYGKLGSIEGARYVFDQLSDIQNVFSWTIMIAAYAQNGHIKSAIKTFREMQCAGEKPNDITLITALGVFAERGHLTECKGLHSCILGCEYAWNPQINTAVIHMYGKCESPKDARSAFDSVPVKLRNVVAWNTMIAAYAQNGHGTEAFEIYWAMERLGVEPTEVTFLSILGACSGRMDLEKVKAIHRRITGTEMEGNIKVCTELVNTYGKCGSLEDASALFNEMKAFNVVTWNAIISVCSQNERGEEAIQLYLRMNLEGLRPTATTFSSVLEGCASAGALAIGRLVHERVALEVRNDVILGTSLINMYGRCGSVDEARTVFDSMSVKNVVTWNTIMSAYARRGHTEDALEMYHLMQQEGVRAIAATFVIALNVCSHAGLLVPATDLFASMQRDFGIEPVSEHLGCMVDLMGRGGWIQEAADVVEMVKAKDEAMWLAFLNACKMQSDTHAAGSAFRMDLGSSSAPYVLLSRVYMPI